MQSSSNGQVGSGDGTALERWARVRPSHVMESSAWPVLTWRMALMRTPWLFMYGPKLRLSHYSSWVSPSQTIHGETGGAAGGQGETGSEIEGRGRRETSESTREPTRGVAKSHYGTMDYHLTFRNGCDRPDSPPAFDGRLSENRRVSQAMRARLQIKPALIGEASQTLAKSGKCNDYES